MPLFYSSISIETASMVYGVPTATENSMFHMAAERWVAPPLSNCSSFVQRLLGELEQIPVDFTHSLHA
jgi:hypothetical protein